VKFLSNVQLGRALVWLSAAVFVGGLVVFLATRTGSEAQEPSPAARPAAQQQGPKGKAATLDEAARAVAGKFILTAVARTDLAASYQLVHPDLRQGFTLAQWKTGEIPVVPYEVESIEQARFRVEEAYPNQLLLEVALIPKEGSSTRAAVFQLGLKDTAKGASRHWLVDYWMPRWSPPIPAAPG
jgi:hypothetical protein